MKETVFWKVETLGASEKELGSQVSWIHPEFQIVPFSPSQNHQLELSLPHAAHAFLKQLRAIVSTEVKGQRVNIVQRRKYV